MDEIRKFHFQQDYLGCVDDEANIVKKCEARRQGTSENISSSLSRWLDRLKSYMMTAEYMIKTTTLLKIQRELCMFSPLPDLIGIDMDERMFLFLQAAISLHNFTIFSDFNFNTLFFLRFSLFTEKPTVCSLS